jgi:hypothetical protein
MCVHVIVALDDLDPEAIHHVYVGFDTDEQAVSWASDRLEPGMWFYALGDDIRTSDDLPPVREEVRR